MEKALSTFSDDPLIWRQHIVDVARTWIGTPYHHQASLKGVGTDCFGLVRGVWREVYELDKDPEDMPPYSWDWAEAKDEETMLEAAKRHMEEVPMEEMGAGDVILFRYRQGYNAKHAAVLTSSNRMVHASRGNITSEVYLNDWWLRHAAGAFQFPMKVR
jgi:NlpC/P60 family putative phage cell wall peptidase